LVRRCQECWTNVQELIADWRSPGLQADPGAMPINRLRSCPPNRLRSSLRRVGLIAASSLVVSCALLTGALPAAASASTSLPPEGIFDNCQLNTQMPVCLQRLQVIQSGGFHVVVIDADEGSPSSDASYAAAAQQLGMKVMWEISNPGWWQNTSVSGQFSGFATACGCTDNSGLLTYMINFLGSQPGTWGYYAADDTMLSSGDQAGVSDFVSQIKAVDPTHPVILSSADETQASQYASIGDMNAAEIYPITNGALMPVSRHQGDWQSIGQEAADDQRMANQNGKSSAFILQAFSWGDNLSDGEAMGICGPSMSQLQCWDSAIYPTAADQLQLRNEILKHAHPSIIIWWSFMGTYGQAGTDTYSTYPTGAAAASNWAGLTAAINAPAPGATIAHAARVKHRRHHRHHRRHRHHHRHHRRHHHRRG
jgi:hypothetical protein